jgi:hypothetical protein
LMCRLQKEAWQTPHRWRRHAKRCSCRAKPCTWPRTKPRIRGALQRGPPGDPRNLSGHEARPKP